MEQAASAPSGFLHPEQTLKKPQLCVTLLEAFLSSCRLFNLTRTFSMLRSCQLCYAVTDDQFRCSSQWICILNTMLNSLTLDLYFKGLGTYVFMAKVDFVGIIKTPLTSSFWVWVLVVGKDKIIIEQNRFYSSYHFAAAFFSEHITHVLSDWDSLP